ncbi:MAG: ketoacyl-ACP synthase III, partial [Acidobacteria bacterium]|nr:ketoacyl-ACP synthase III [Acidobacteriota bacterium]
AAVLEPTSQPGFLAAAARADGSYAGRWGLFAGGTAEPASVEAVTEGRTQVRCLEPYPPEINLEGWPRLVRELARRGGFEVEEIDLAVFTQVRKPTIEAVMADLGLPVERTHTIMESCGYTGSACIPMAFDDAVREGKVKAGDLVVFVGSGVGYNQAGAAFRMGSAPEGKGENP